MRQREQGVKKTAFPLFSPFTRTPVCGEQTYAEHSKVLAGPLAGTEDGKIKKENGLVSALRGPCVGETQGAEHGEKTSITHFAPKPVLGCFRVKYLIQFQR